jgi:hypothetical protein
MVSKKIFSIVLLFSFLAVGCASPGALTSDEVTHVAGVVVDGSNYDRVANAQIQFMNDDVSATTDENGIFTAMDISVGTQTVNIQTENHGSVEKTVEIVNGGSRLQLMIE